MTDLFQVVVYEYLNFIERCVRKESFFNALIRSLDLVGAIVQVATGTSHSRERFSAVDLHVKTACFVKKKIL